MAKRIKSEVEVRRAEAEQAQANFDRATAAMGAEYWTGVVYGQDPSSPFSVALAEDADRSHFRFMLRLEWLRGDVSSAQTKLDRFAVDLSKDAANAFRWATDAVKAAADVKVITIYTDLLTGKGPDVANKVALQEALRGARSPSRSTSPMANLVEECETAAWAELAEKRS